jgi:cytosine/adenosine deaminase-related metal-dependent hydrolase
MQSAEALAGAIHFFERAGKEKGGFGISPHAPYTASKDLYSLVKLFGEKYRLPVCTHLAESEEEIAMFCKGSGVLYEFLSSIGRPMDDCVGKTPLEMLMGGGLLPEGSLLVHMNFLNDADREIMKNTKGRYPVIHCPRTHSYFGRPAFDLKFFQENGIPLLLGTDSLASNHDLNMFAEMRAMASSFPELDPGEILAMATTRPAAAIGWKGRLGELSPGAIADFLAIPDEGETGVDEQILANRFPPKVWISGVSDV